MIYTPIYLQKATQYDSKSHAKLLAGRWIQEKLDGVGAQVVINYPDIQIYAMSEAKASGQFSNFTRAVPHIISELRLSTLQNGIYQGELITDEVPEESDNVGFINGILHAADSLERQAEERYKLKLVLYEVPSSDKIYSERYEYLYQAFGLNAFPYPLKYVKVNSILGINDKDNTILDNKYKEIITRGGEGVVLYDPNCLYKHSDNSCPRNKGLIKIKDCTETEVLCVKKIEGKGKHQNTLGALQAIDKNGKEFRIGSFSINNTQRKYIWDNVEVPFVAEIVYFKPTNTSYKIPRFKRLREDKDIDSWNRVD